MWVKWEEIKELGMALSICLRSIVYEKAGESIDVEDFKTSLQGTGFGMNCNQRLLCWV